MSAAHEPLSRERHAEVVAYLCYHNARVWSAIFRAERYVYDERDQERGWDLDAKCFDLGLAFQRVTDWQTMLLILRRLVRTNERRRKMSIGIHLGKRILYGEAI